MPKLHFDIYIEKTPLGLILEWAQSVGFAEVHNGEATNEEIAKDLLAFLELKGFKIAPKDQDGTD